MRFPGPQLAFELKSPRLHAWAGNTSSFENDSRSANRAGKLRVYRCGLLDRHGCESGPIRKAYTEPDAAQRDPDPTAQRHTFCGSVGGMPETYSFVLMNRKLAKYPAFAAAIGMSSVSSCDEARAFMAAYNRYTLKHPEID